MATVMKEADASHKYDVFLCFRGLDTYTFACNLYYALRNEKIKTFFFPKEIQNHDDQLQLSLSVIQESKISVVVLSQNYASSTRCLDELVKIIECMEWKNQLVWPIFYDVDPSEVRHQKGRFGEGMLELEKTYPDRIVYWREALRQVSSISGWNYGTDQFEYELIEKIVESTIFMDDEGLEGGNQISQTLLKAIGKSRLSIVVLSENYGYSTWCLDELVKIMECKKAKNQLVWPIFYKIEQSDVINQTKSYGKAMTAHENGFGKDSENVQKWRSALSEVALLKGDHINENQYEYEFIKKIVERAIEAENHM
ncbi:unnamed protein product [Vicia faba]|uniref:TIR domain-containing protein n=1 Tax=Vicia faba TaxID=3906 RepID=A0AAV0YS24_VICFA|nr:unnamed protein product [Vicia faba]